MIYILTNLLLLIGGCVVHTRTPVPHTHAYTPGCQLVVYYLPHCPWLIYDLFYNLFYYHLNLFITFPICSVVPTIPHTICIRYCVLFGILVVIQLLNVVVVVVTLILIWFIVDFFLHSFIVTVIISDSHVVITHTTYLPHCYITLVVLTRLVTTFLLFYSTYNLFLRFSPMGPNIVGPSTPYCNLVEAPYLFSYYYGLLGILS